MDLQWRRSFQLAFFCSFSPFLLLFYLALYSRMGWAVGPIFCGDPSPRLVKNATPKGGCQFQFSSFHKGQRRPKIKLRINKARTGPVFDSAKNLWNMFCSLHERSGILFYLKRVKSPFSGVSVDCTTDKRWQFHSRGSI